MPTANFEPSSSNDSSAKTSFKIGYGDYIRFRNLILERSGLNFPEKKRGDLEAGILRALSESPLAPTHNLNLDNYFRRLSDKDDSVGQSELKRLINTLTVGETYFFRDEAQMNALEHHVLPTLIAKKRAAAKAIGNYIQPQLRIWSAGAATGEEPYSLAMLLKELLPDIDNWHILILATDINHDSLARAREGIYTNWSFRENRAKTLKNRYFTQLSPTRTGPRTERYRLRDDIRQMVTFASLNLIEDEYPAIHNNTVSIDLILCRNVTIYFTEETTRRVIAQFYNALVRGGWLIVGHSEPSLFIYKDFQARNFPDTILYQKTDQPTNWPDDWAEPSQQQIPPTPTPFPKPSFKPPSSFPTPSSPPKPAFKPNDQPTNPKKFNPTPQARPNPSSNIDPYQLGQNLLKKGQIEEAIRQLKHKVATTPNFAPAHALLGQAYANLGQWSEAQKWCQSAIKLDSLQASAYSILAMVYQNDGQLNSAIDAYKKSIYLERTAPVPHFNLAVLYKQKGELKKAERSLQNAIKILERWPPNKILPDTGGDTAQRLLQTAHLILKRLKNN